MKMTYNKLTMTAYRPTNHMTNQINYWTVSNETVAEIHSINNTKYKEKAHQRQN